MEGAEAFIAEIENEAQHRKEPRPIFEAATPGDLQKFKEKNLNKNTTKSTNTWVNCFEAWRRWRELPHKLEDIPKQDLNGTLEQFFAEVRKSDGSEYEPDSLRTMLAALDRHLRQAGSKFSIIKDREFDGCRKTLNGRAIVLREEGLGKKKMKADALTLEEEEQLWTRDVLGGNNAVSLNHTVFFMISQEFGTRGCQEHHQLRVEDLKFVRDPQGKTMYVEWVEGLTKTRQGGLKKMDRRLPQKLFATDDERCPVRFLEHLISKRPKSLSNVGPLYLRPLQKPQPDVWYSSQPAGVHKINSFMREIVTLGGLDCTNKRFTNHSIRKTTVRKLQKAGVSNDKIAAVTGHRSEQSLRDYAVADMDDHKRMSSILSKPTALGDRTNARSSTEHLAPVQPQMPQGMCPQYGFTNCTVYFNSGCSSSSSSQVQLNVPAPPKRRRIIIESDSDED